MLKGTIANKGYAIGSILKIDADDMDTAKIEISNVNQEISCLHQAIEQTVLQLKHLKESSSHKFDEEILHIFDAHIAIATDPEFIHQIEKKIKSESCNLAHAVKFNVDIFIDMFKNIDDEYMRQRASDLLEVSEHIIKNHLNIKPLDFKTIDCKVILASHEINASQAAQINPKCVLGIISEVGGKDTHSSIIARQLGIPALVGVENLMNSIKDNDLVILDAVDGKVVQSVSKEQLEFYKNKIFDFKLTYKKS